MNKEIRILILEDVPADAELAERELRRAGIVFTSKRVDTRDAFTRELEDFKPDIILADYRLPAYDGRSAVQLVRQEHPEVPVIMVTGTLGDETAIELLKAGARDYVLKDGLARLGPAVRRALSEEQGIRDRKRAERAVKDSERRFRSLIEHASDLVVVVDAQGQIAFISPAVQRLGGYEVEEILGTNYLNYAHAEDRPAAAAGLAELLHGPDKPHVSEFRFRAKDGAWVTLESIARNALDDPAINGIVINSRDITERKREEHRRLLEAKRLEVSLALSKMLGESEQAILDFVLEECLRGTESRYSFIGWINEDESAMTIHAWSKDTMARCAVENMPRVFPLAEAGLWAEPIRQHRTVIINDWAKPHEHKHGIPAGHVEIKRYLGVPIFERGRIVLIVAVANKESAYAQSDADHLTRLMADTWSVIQRNQFEIRLQQSEERFRGLVESTSDWIWEVDKAGVYTYCSPKIMDILGYAPEELVGRSTFDFMPADEAARVGKLFAEFIAAKKPFTALENANLHRDGHRVVLETSGVPVLDAKGDLLGYRGVDRDITQRKEHEARIEHLNRLIRSARSINHLITREKDRGQLLQTACDVLVRETRYRMVWIGATEQGHKRVVPVAQAGFTDGYLDSVTITWDETPTGQGPSGTAIRTRERSITQDLESEPRYAPWREAAVRRGYRSSATLPLISNNHIYGVLNIFADKPNTFDAEEIALLDEVADDIAFALRGMDVESDRKRSEEALRDSEEKLRTISSSAQDGIVMVDNDGTIEFWNPSAEKLFGYTAEEAIGKPLHELIVPERLREKAQPGFEKFKATGQGPIIGKVLELPSLRKDGTELGTEHSISAVKLKGKWHAVAVVRDITERRLAEKSLLKSATELKEAQRVARLGNWDLDPETGSVTWSDELYRVFGRDPALPAPSYEEHPRILVPESYARMNAAIERTRHTGEPYEVDLELVRPDGTRKWITARGEAKRDFNGQIVGLRGTALDITERKRAEADRQQYAEKLGRSLEETIKAVALTVEMRDPYTAGHQRRVADLAVAIAKQLGLPEEQSHGLHLAGIIHDLGKIQIPAEILSKPGKLTDIEFSFIKTHPQAGYSILKEVEFPWPIAQMVLQHHERLDGSGYPQELKAEQILLEARILAVVDVVEAMASHRPYRAALGIEVALKEIERGRSSAYDPVIADACLKLFREGTFALPP